MAVWSIVKVSELEGSNRLDAEYYKPEYLGAAEKLRESGAEYLGNLLSDIRYGIYTEPDYLRKGTDFLRAVNLEELTIQGKILKVNDSVVPSEKYLLRPGDLLIVRSGANVGNVGVIIDRYEGATFGSYTIRIRTKSSVNPFILYIFLKSKYGRVQTVRFRTGLAQPNINIPNLKLLQVFSSFPTSFQKDVENLVKRSHKEVINSQSLYLQAERMVLKKIGWDELDLSQPKYWSAPLARARETNRLDAEHFQPKYDKLIAHLKKTGKAKQIKDLLAEPIKKGITPDYNADGCIVAINSQNLGRFCLDFERTVRTTEEFWVANNRAQILRNDVMIYATGAYIGRTNAYLEKFRALAGVDILLARPTEFCNPLYLSVFLNAPPGLMQSKRLSSGSGQAHIYPKDLCRYWIYIPTPKFQQKVADMVQQSWTARRRARAMLDDAKQMVEKMIEKGASEK